jgi:hypothetical protein
MNRYAATETHFALLTIGEQKKTVLENEQKILTERSLKIDLAITTGEGKGSVLSDGYTIAEDILLLEAQRELVVVELENLGSNLEDEAIKLRKQKEENVRRRHNYVPMAITLLRHLAAKNKLSDLVSLAEQRRATNLTNRLKNKAAN